MFLEISIAVRSPLVLLNALILYASYMKSRQSVADILTTGSCTVGITHFILSLLSLVTVKLVLGQTEKLLLACQDLVDSFFYVLYCQIMAFYFIDRYIAAVFPLLYKVKVRLKYAYVSLTLAASIGAILLIFTVVLTYSDILEYDKYSLDKIVLTFILLSCTIVIGGYASICRALFHFFGRQMTFFRKRVYHKKQSTDFRHRTIKRQNATPTKTCSPLNFDIPYRSLSKGESNTSPKLSLPLLDFPLSDHGKTDLRRTRFSCPILTSEELYAENVPVWIIDSLAKEIEKEKEIADKALRRERANTFPISCQKDSDANGTTRPSPVHCYSLVNLLSDLRFLKNSRDSIDFSQTRHLLRNLTMKMVVHIFSSIPFIVSVLPIFGILKKFSTSI